MTNQNEQSANVNPNLRYEYIDNGFYRNILKSCREENPGMTFEICSDFRYDGECDCIITGTYEEFNIYFENMVCYQDEVEFVRSELVPATDQTAPAPKLKRGLTYTFQFRVVQDAPYRPVGAKYNGKRHGMMRFQEADGNDILINENYIRQHTKNFRLVQTNFDDPIDHEYDTRP